MSVEAFWSPSDQKRRRRAGLWFAFLACLADGFFSAVLWAVKIIDPTGHMWAWLKINQEGQTAGFGPCFHLPGFHFDIGFLSHGHVSCSQPELGLVSFSGRARDLDLCKRSAVLTPFRLHVSERATRNDSLAPQSGRRVGNGQLLT